MHHHRHHRHHPRHTLPVCRHLIALMLAALAATLAHPARAAEPAFRCAGLLPSATRTPAYTRAAGEARCEGFFDGTVSQPFIELLSLTQQRPDALPALPAVGVLTIKASGTADAQVLIQPLRPSPFYRVDAALAAGQALAWNAAPMLASTGLRLADLGFLARAAFADGSTLPRVLPVSLGAAGSPSDGAMAYAVLRVSVAVGSVAARSVVAGNTAGSTAGNTAGSGWRTLPGTPLDAWDTLVLTIPLGDAAGARGDVHVDVRAVDPAGQLLPLLQFAVVAR